MSEPSEPRKSTLQCNALLVRVCVLPETCVLELKPKGDAYIFYGVFPLELAF